MIKFNLENTSNFSPISLNQMDGVKLMNRSDTKFTFGYSKLASLLEKLIPYYQLLEINGKRIHSYKSLYFDTQESERDLESFLVKYPLYDKKGRVTHTGLMKNEVYLLNNMISSSLNNLVTNYLSNVGDDDW